jgi:hypothetical protein
MVTRGFGGRRPPREQAERLPPGQYLTEDFPVLSAGPTPQVRLEDWSFTLKSDRSRWPNGTGRRSIACRSAA